MENFKKIVFLVCEVGNVVGAAKGDDGKIDIKDAPKLIALWDELTALLSVNLEAAWAEAKRMLESAVWAEVMADAAAKYDIPNDEVEAKIEGTIEGIGLILSGGSRIVGAWKK